MIVEILTIKEIRRRERIALVYLNVSRRFLYFCFLGCACAEYCRPKAVFSIEYGFFYEMMRWGVRLQFFGKEFSWWKADRYDK